MPFSRSRTLSLLVAMLAMLGTGFLVSPAQAALRAPGGLTPSGDNVAGSPVLTWDRVPGATSYDVQVSSSPDFAVVKYKVSTSNRRATPTVELPPGDVWWRVSARSSSGTSDWSTTSFQRDVLAGPTLLSPSDDTVLDQPEDPALLAWEPVDGAVSYSVEIDDASDFINPTTYSTKTSSYVVPKPQIATVYHWRVRAVLAGGVLSDYSEDRTYELGGLDKPALESPLDNAVDPLQDVVLDWEPVAGAATYDLQVSTDDSFNTIDDARTGIRGTRYSPPISLRNDQYYWRVRPVDTLGNQLDWSQVDVWSFRRNWPDQPELVYPVAGAVVGDPFYYQWTPVPHADRYAVQMSPTGDFQDAKVTQTCYTVHTTFTPGDTKHSGDDCYPGGMGTYSWRVIAFDGPRSTPLIQTDAITAAVETFSYAPETVMPGDMSPSDGATVQIPTLSWTGVPGAAEYKVTITALDGGAGGGSDVTAATSYTSRRLLTPGKTYRWSVQPYSGNRRPGPVLTADAQPTFTVGSTPTGAAAAPQPLSPYAGASSTRMPTLTWTPVANAAYYKIGFRKKGAIAAFTELPDRFVYPAGEDTDYRAFDSYEWAVSAYDKNGSKIGSTGDTSWLTLTPLPEVSSVHVAMTGQASRSSATSCVKALPQRCEDMRQTPVLRWDPVPGAGLYKLYVSRDKEMTNLLPSYPRFVDNTAWMSDKALFDSQAGDAFYWSVSPCVSTTVCDPPIHAPWAFNKKSNPVELSSPGEGAVVADDVTFEWGDYLDTNQSAGGVDSTGLASGIEAQQYLVEVSKDANFQTRLEKVEVDQTTYTSFTRAYPEGTLYWRVSAIDGSGNVLTPSETRTFTKQSEAPTLVSPTGNEVVAQTEAFRWDAMPFASGYDIEVYRNGDTIGQPANKVFSGSSKQAAFTTTAPLPASDLPYTWRIRRVDASGNDGAWTDLSAPSATFRISGTAPSLKAPADGAVVAGDDALFTWQAVDGASSYRFERRAKGSTSMAEVVTTPSLAWAPTRTIGEGSWQWRVSSLDAAGKVSATSEWRSVSVDGGQPTVTSKSPTGTVSRGSSFTVRFSERVTKVSSTTFRIYQKGRPDPLPAKVKLSSTGTSATLDPKRNLKAGRYTVKLTSGITDGAGNALVPASWKVRVR